MGLCGVMFFADLGAVPFHSRGEAREALEVREIVDSSEWILPLLNGDEIPSKPPLFHWLAAATALATGEISEFDVRFPSALLATFSVFLVFWWGGSKWGWSAGFCAAAILAASPAWVQAARSARVDMTLAACLLCAFLSFGAVKDAPRPTLPALLAFYASMGFATLAKGPVGFVVPSLVALVVLVVRRDLGRLWRMRPILGLLLILAIAGSWYVLAIGEGGEAFVRKQLLAENVLRFFGDGDGHVPHPHPFYYYLPGFFIGFAPWSIFVLPLAIHLYRQRGRLDEMGYLYPLIWLGVIVLFYSLSAGKRHVYILPVYPAAACLLGAFWSDLMDTGRESPTPVGRVVESLAWALAGIVGLVAVSIGLQILGLDVLAIVEPLLNKKNRQNLPFLQQALVADPWIVSSVLVLLTGLAALFAVAVRQRRWRVALAALLAMVAGGEEAITEVVQPKLAAMRTFEPLAVEMAIVPRSEPLVFYETFDYGAVFYAGRHIPVYAEHLPGSDRPLYVLVWENKWRDLLAATSKPPTIVLRSAGIGTDSNSPLLLARVEAGTVLHPAMGPMRCIKRYECR